MCEVSNLQTSPNSKKHPYFWGTFGELQLKKALQIPVTPFSAESEGFEPPDPLRSTVFKTAAFDHSAISPIPFWDCKSRNKSLFCKKYFTIFQKRTCNGILVGKMPLL